MSEKANEELNSLAHWLFDLEQWLTNASLTNANSGEQPQYDNWNKLNESFITFLHTKENEPWLNDEITVIERLITINPRMFMSALPTELLPVMVAAPFSNQLTKIDLLNAVSQLRDPALRLRLKIKFFEGDDSALVKKLALKALVQEGWSEAEQHVLKLWDSGDMIKRMVALDCLSALNSPLLESYLQLAEQSNDPSLKRFACEQRVRAAVNEK